MPTPAVRVRPQGMGHATRSLPRLGRWRHGAAVTQIRRRLCVRWAPERHDGMTITRVEAPIVREATADVAWDAVLAIEQASGQRLYGYALRLGVDAGRAGDLVQEALLRLWRELGRGSTIDSPEAWTYRTLARLAMDEHRLHRRIAGLIARMGDRMTVRVMEVDSTDRVAVWSQVDRLPDRQRQVVYLRFQADLSFDEIAHVMGITPGAARSHATSALRTLRTRLDMTGELDMAGEDE